MKTKLKISTMLLFVGSLATAPGVIVYSGSLNMDVGLSAGASQILYLDFLAGTASTEASATSNYALELLQPLNVSSIRFDSYDGLSQVVVQDGEIDSPVGALGKYAAGEIVDASLGTDPGVSWAPAVP